jgi:hypothetical protein
MGRGYEKNSIIEALATLRIDCGIARRRRPTSRLGGELVREEAAHRGTASADGCLGRSDRCAPPERRVQPPGPAEGPWTWKNRSGGPGRLQRLVRPHRKSILLSRLFAREHGSSLATSGGRQAA